MLFIFSTPVIIRHLWQLKMVVFLHWYSIKHFKQPILIGLQHPLDGVTNPKYKLFHFIQLTKFFAKRRRHQLLAGIGAASSALFTADSLPLLEFGFLAFNQSSNSSKVCKCLRFLHQYLYPILDPMLYQGNKSIFMASWPNGEQTK